MMAGGFTRDDAWLLASVVGCSRRAAAVGVVDLLDDMDFHMRAVPGYSVFADGIPRLEAAGLMAHGVDANGDLWLRPTTRARLLARDAFPWRITHLTCSIDTITEALGATGYLCPVRVDGDVEPLADWSEEAYERACRAYSKAFWKDAREAFRLRSLLVFPLQLSWALVRGFVEHVDERVWLRLQESAPDPRPWEEKL